MGLADRMAVVHYITVLMVVWISDSCCEGQGRSPGEFKEVQIHRSGLMKFIETPDM